HGFQRLLAATKKGKLDVEGIDWNPTTPQLCETWMQSEGWKARSGLLQWRGHAISLRALGQRTLRETQYLQHNGAPGRTSKHVTLVL
ncbi:hypothetical protein JG687_00007356, partial [Phytophthora cactorum]